ncbi:3-hydroxybutyryl-CoA dehydrogenase [Bordetella genomosp. 1]|uniref:3-hydroxybutyryl-CoA dehydrogenase n=1 Tax=Bordetella genomosp. 1 TaxID=1395607 RepID=A0A261S739_9BORD|nr:3-hydroxyacyl-CoA dehydrogenase family protein [Bordetella genomosp. 1]OZI33188.1 3-hydroxybutyryl-CoA dehydrogenase [Bordetella genomosp. 1]
MNRGTRSASTHVAVLGAGLMGHGIAQVFSQAGFGVSIWDPDQMALTDVPRRIAEHLEQLGETPKGEITLSSTLAECVRGCDLVVEAAPERLELKQNLIRQIDEANPDCIIASNTSVLRITEIALNARNPHRIVGTHWWNPPYLIPVVEVVRGEQTGEGAAARVTQWLLDAGKLPVDVFKDAPGFVGNRMQFALVREAAHIVDEGICSAETVDLVARHTFGRRIAAVGPLRNSDYIGLDLVEAILDYLAPSLSDARRTPALIRKLVADGRKGAKTGSGIFEWREGERKEAEERLLKHLMAMQSLTASH